ncbi:MAG: 4Fe-4S binding protein [Eggerthellaceae bacterium]|nr:4Fe-4S binding protein [Eggerthellaceae bacterium]
MFLKPMSYFSLLRITCDHSKCVQCGTCGSVCPMDVDMLDDARSRQNGTECILCLECVRNCSQDAL